MKKDIKAYVHACKTCQWTKSSNQAKAAPLHPNEIPSWPWMHISVDMITGLPESNGYDMIIMIIDCFCKEIIPVACTATLSSEGWAKILRDKVYAWHGMPQIVISDCGPQFMSCFMKDLYALLHIKSNASTAFHPQTNGQTERANQEIEKYLRLFVNYAQNDWAEWLALAEFTHNNRVHSATGKPHLKSTADSTPMSFPTLTQEQYWEPLHQENSSSRCRISTKRQRKH